MIDNFSVLKLDDGRLLLSRTVLIFAHDGEDEVYLTNAISLTPKQQKILRAFFAKEDAEAAHTPEYEKHMEDTITKFGPLSSRDSDGDAEYRTWMAEIDEHGSSHEEWVARLVTAESYAEDARDGAR